MDIYKTDFADFEKRALANLSTEEKAAMYSGKPLHHKFEHRGTVTGRFLMNLPACEDIPRKSNVPKEE